MWIWYRNVMHISLEICLRQFARIMLEKYEYFKCTYRESGREKAKKKAKEENVYMSACHFCSFWNQWFWYAWVSYTHTERDTHVKPPVMIIARKEWIHAANVWANSLYILLACVVWWIEIEKEIVFACVTSTSLHIYTRIMQITKRIHSDEKTYTEHKGERWGWRGTGHIHNK